MGIYKPDTTKNKKMRIWTLLLVSLLVDSKRDPAQMSKKRLMRKNLKMRKEAAERDLSKARRKAKNRIKNQSQPPLRTARRLVVAPTLPPSRLVVAPRALPDKRTDPDADEAIRLEGTVFALCLV